MVENKVREEVLYREALAMGLDKDDTIVKRRMAQKMQFLAEDVAAAYEPDERNSRPGTGATPTSSRCPAASASARSTSLRTGAARSARDDAEKALAKLAGQPVDSHARRILQRSRSCCRTTTPIARPYQLAKEFGPAFAQAVFRPKPGAWQGPIESGFGWHLVFVDSIIPGRAPDFAEVESEVKTAWLGEQKAEGWRKAYEAMRAKYTVLLPLPPESAGAEQRPTAPAGGSPAPAAKPQP